MHKKCISPHKAQREGFHAAKPGPLPHAVPLYRGNSICREGGGVSPVLYKGAKPTGEHTGTMPPLPVCVTSHRALRALAARRSLLQMDSQKAQPTFRLNSHFDNSSYSRSLRYALHRFSSLLIASCSSAPKLLCVKSLALIHLYHCCFV